MDLQKETQNLDIVHLMDNNPITRLNKSYQTLFIQKIKENFTESQQNMFVSSFYCYLNYNTKTDYVISLDDVWKWLGFGRKNDCKKVITKNFTEDVDYKVIVKPATEVAVKDTNAQNLGGAGLNKELVLMNITTFKKVCLKSKTKKADEIHDYFIKLEETLQEIIDEESNDLREQLRHNFIQNIQDKQNVLLESYHKISLCYLIHIYGLLYKFGNTDNIKRRLKEHRREIGADVKLIFCIKSDNNTKLEQKLKDFLKQTDHRKEQLINGHLQTELIEIDDITIIQDKLTELNLELVSDKQLILELKAENSDLRQQLEKYQDGQYTAHVFPNNIYGNYLSANLQYSESSKIDLKAIMDSMETHIKKNNLKSLSSMYSNTYHNFHGYAENFKIELVNQIKELFPCSCYKDNGVKRHFVNLCFKDCTSHFPEAVYKQFINDTLQVGTQEKDQKGGFTFKVKTQTVINKFLQHIGDKKIEPLFRMNESDKLMHQEFIKQICKLTNARDAASVKHNGIDARTFVGISLK